MKVLNLANVAGQKRGAGVHEVAFSYYELQNDSQVDSHLWFPGYESEAFDLIKEVKNSQQKNNIIALPTFLHPNYGLLKFKKKYRKEVLSFDIIHQHGIWLQNSELSIYGHKNGIPIVIQPHGYLEEYSLNMSRFKKKLMYNLFERINLSNASILVGCSHREVKQLKYLFPNKNIALIPNGIWQNFSDHSIIEPGYKSKKRLLFLSRIHPSKGVDRLLKSFSNLDQSTKNSWEIVVAGTGEPRYIEFLKNEAIRLRIENSVTFYGPAYSKEKIELFDSCDVFALPTHTENFGIVIAEAMSRSKPVFTTEGAPWKIINEINCGLWVNNNQKGIDSGLKKILSFSEDTLQNMGKRGKELIDENYIWESVGERTIEMYRWLLGEIDYVPEFIFLGDNKLKEKNLFKK